MTPDAALAAEVKRLREENAVTLEGLRAKQEALVAGNEALLAAEAREQGLLATIARVEALLRIWNMASLDVRVSGGATPTSIARMDQLDECHDELREALKGGEP